MRPSQIFPETETFNFGFETRPRPFENHTEMFFRDVTNGTVFLLQTATNYAVFCSFITQNTDLDENNQMASGE